MNSNSTPLSPHLLNAQQVADQLNVSERWVRDHATRRHPRLPVVKLGTLLRFQPADVDEFLNRQRDDHSGTTRRQLNRNSHSHEEE